MDCYSVNKNTGAKESYTVQKQKMSGMCILFPFSFIFFLVFHFCFSPFVTFPLPTALVLFLLILISITFLNLINYASVQSMEMLLKNDVGLRLK